MARKLAAKVSLVARYDAFHDRVDPQDGDVAEKEEEEGQLEEIQAAEAKMGIECRAYMEKELQRAQQLAEEREQQRQLRQLNTKDNKEKAQSAELVDEWDGWTGLG